MSSRRSTSEPHSPSLSLSQQQHQPGTHTHPSTTPTPHHDREHDASGFQSPTSSPNSFGGFAHVPNSATATASVSSTSGNQQHSGLLTRGSHATVLLGSPQAGSGGAGTWEDGESLQRGPRVMSIKRHDDLLKQVGAPMDATSGLGEEDVANQLNTYRRNIHWAGLWISQSQSDVLLVMC